MPPSQLSSQEEVINFLLLCLQYAQKPDFEKVGAESGLAPTAAYKKLWGMQKRFRDSKGGAGAGGGPPTSPKKRVAKPKTPNTSPKKARKGPGAKTDQIGKDVSDLHG